MEVRGSSLAVGPHCHEDARVRLDEGPDEVRLTFEVRGESMGDCYDTVEVELDGPLDDRPLVDAETGMPVRTGRH